MAHASAQSFPHEANRSPGDPAREALLQLEQGTIPWLIPRWAVLADVIDGGADPRLAGDPEVAFDEMFAATGIDFQLGATRTFYSHSDDVIVLADWRRMDTADFYRDWIHELVHATGHASRLGRSMPRVFGHNAHDTEDLVAEMGTAILCASLGFAPGLRHPDSLGMWIDLVRADPSAYPAAEKQAREAAGYLLARRDAQAASFARWEAEEVLREQAEEARWAAARRLERCRERERWALRSATVSRPGERLLAARLGDFS